MQLGPLYEPDVKIEERQQDASLLSFKGLRKEMFLDKNVNERYHAKLVML